MGGRDGRGKGREGGEGVSKEKGMGREKGGGGEGKDPHCFSDKSNPAFYIYITKSELDNLH